MITWTKDTVATEIYYALDKTLLIIWKQPNKEKLSIYVSTQSKYLSMLFNGRELDTDRKDYMQQKWDT